MRGRATIVKCAENYSNNTNLSNHLFWMLLQIFLKKCNQNPPMTVRVWLQTKQKTPAEVINNPFVQTNRTEQE